MLFLKLVHLLFVVRLRRLFVDGHLINEILAAFSDLNITKAKRNLPKLRTKEFAICYSKYVFRLHKYKQTLLLNSKIRIEKKIPWLFLEENPPVYPVQRLVVKFARSIRQQLWSVPVVACTKKKRHSANLIRHKRAPYIALTCVSLETARSRRQNDTHSQRRETTREGVPPS